MRGCFRSETMEMEISAGSCIDLGSWRKLKMEDDPFFTYFSLIRNDLL